MTTRKAKVTLLRRKACPVCRKPASAEYQPFCSARCRDLDLKKWLGGEYRIPTDEPPAEGPPPEGDELDHG
jgi:endogenous inhibitor of DNA gyrase (YacG/DUF329 family)